MTEDQIEARVERMMDHLDRVFMAGQIDQKTYDLGVRDLHIWAEAKYQEARQSPRHHFRSTMY